LILGFFRLVRQPVLLLGFAATATCRGEAVLAIPVTDENNKGEDNVNWFKRLCHRRNRKKYHEHWFWDALFEIRNAYFDEEFRHYRSLPEDDQFGHIFESLQLLDEVLEAMQQDGWVPRSAPYRLQ
jgi:hypothetical protein